LEHHLASSLPWFQQLRLHACVRSVMTPPQRKQFLLEPVVGWPKLWSRIVRELYGFRRQAQGTRTAASGD
jgi:fatty acid desaturase